MLPVLRNTVTGLNGLDPRYREAARVIGMSPARSLREIELPLALPVIMAGIRTAAVWVIGTATLATPIGQESLGNYIFTGLQTQNWIFVIFGCVAAAVLALAVDQLLALMQTGAALRSTWRLSLGALGVLAIIAGALVPGLARSRATYVIGAKTFTEQYVLASLVQQRLAAAGLSARKREGLGSNVIFAALVANEIDVYVDYSGTLSANELKRTDIKPRAEVLAEVTQALAERSHITVLGGLGFENAYALMMPRKRAEALGIRSDADLARYAATMSIAGDYEFFARPEWTKLREAYGLAFKNQRQMQPDFMYAAVAAGDVDVIAGYTSDGLVAKYDLVALADPKNAIPPYDAVLLISPRRAGDAALRAALAPLIGVVDVATMRAANLRAGGGDNTGSPDTAAQWMWEEIQKKAPR
jgi:osmoprotectant transport system permease protein